MPQSQTIQAREPESRVRLYGWIESGMTGNFDAPNDNQNFGRLLDDRSNEPLLNQLVLTAERTLDPKVSDQFGWGFKAQLFYGTDARYLHATGLLDLTTNDTVQPDIPEAWLMAHFPVTGTEGIDLKVGKFMTCEGADMSDPRMNTFYSRTYIFNFGTPFFGVGALATVHACSCLDVIAGVTRGVNVGIEDNNDSASFYGGLTGSCCDGRCTFAALTHIGPENPRDNHNYRYLSDVVATCKLTDKLTSITDLNYAYEESFQARGYGIAQSFTYSFNEWLTAGLRGEVWRDENGFFVAQFASNNDFLHFERGDDTAFDPRTTGGGRTTYGAVTAGITIKPPLPLLLTGLMIRPELRWDRSLNNTHPFNDSSDGDMLTTAVDLIIIF